MEGDIEHRYSPLPSPPPGVLCVSLARGCTWYHVVPSGVSVNLSSSMLLHDGRLP